MPPKDKFSTGEIEGGGGEYLYALGGAEIHEEIQLKSRDWKGGGVGERVSRSVLPLLAKR